VAATVDDTPAAAVEVVEELTKEEAVDRHQAGVEGRGAF